MKAFKSNIETGQPVPIEDACLRSQYVSQIVLVGQDQKSLGAMIVPNLEALQQWATSQSLPLDFAAESIEFQYLNQSQIINLFREELNREVKNRPGYRADDRIIKLELIAEPFSKLARRLTTIENGLLTQTMKIRRPVVMERYHSVIDEMFAH
jgi:long-chain acyl-CoA synthetase